ncbi:MAG: hypothetical protein ABI680_13005 [Chthoniobacteraceae bacterium]
MVDAQATDNVLIAKELSARLERISQTPGLYQQDGCAIGFLMNLRAPLAVFVSLLALIVAQARTPDGTTKLVLMAGKPSHPPRMHEFNAGVQLLAPYLAQRMPELKVETILNGWPADESVFEGADAVAFYMDGGP